MIAESSNKNFRRYHRYIQTLYKTFHLLLNKLLNNRSDNYRYCPDCEKPALTAILY